MIDKPDRLVAFTHTGKILEIREYGSHNTPQAGLRCSSVTPWVKDLSRLVREPLKVETIIENWICFSQEVHHLNNIPDWVCRVPMIQADAIVVTPIQSSFQRHLIILSTPTPVAAMCLPC